MPALRSFIFFLIDSPESVHARSNPRQVLFFFWVVVFWFCFCFTEAGARLSLRLLRGVVVVVVVVTEIGDSGKRVVASVP